MAGHQFSVFLGPSDQANFEEAIRASGDIAFLNDWPLSAKPEELETSVIRDYGKESFRTLIARRADIADIEFHPIRGREVFSCDPTLAPVVEFSRFPFVVAGRFIRSGRLYRIDKYWSDNGKLVSKPDSFIEWGERLYRLAKKSLFKVEQGCFAGEEALALRKAGVAFEGLDIAMGSITA
jgi:hypothetical protein